MPKHSLRLLHWNVHGWVDPATGGANADAVERLVDAHAPDVVSLVEVAETWGEPSPLAAVAERTGHASVYAPVFERGAGDGPTGGFGNALLTRRPVRAVRQRQLTWPDTVYANDERTEPRCLLLVTVDVAGVPVVVGTTHLPRFVRASRVAALRRLAGIAQALPRPWVVAGDFNAPAGDWVAGRFEVAPPEPAPTCPAGVPGAVPTASIDYAVAARGTAMTAEVLDVPGSDHLPVLVTVEVSGATTATTPPTPSTC